MTTSPNHAGESAAFDGGPPLAQRAVRPGYLFVTGCERSGTTILVRLLQAHPSIALGMERYKYVLRRMRAGRRPARRLSAAHFEPARFFDFRPTDSNIIPPNFQTYYERTAARYRSPDLRYVGDKILPPVPRLLEHLGRRFPSARHIFVYRDALEVANSFEVRARNPDDIWPAENGFELGIEHWNLAFTAIDALAARIGTDPIFCVRYEDLFGGGTDACTALFDFLGLETTASVFDLLADRRRGWDTRRATSMVLTEEQQASVLARVDPDVVARFATLADSRLPNRS